MPVYAITGKLGSGKSLISVGQALVALEEGRKVATNVDLKLKEYFGKSSDKTYYRLPDKPTITDLLSIGKGNESYDEERNGIVLLDELGLWLDSRGWQDKSRKPLHDWLVHARKLGWDIYLIIHDVDSLDSSVKRDFIEHTVFCKRLDRVNVPIIGPLYKFFTAKRLKGPKIHIAKVVYGTSPNDYRIDRWFYKGKNIYKAYDTKQVFSPDYPHGCYSVLPPSYQMNVSNPAKRGIRFYMRLTKIYWKKFKSPLALAVGILLGTSFAVANGFKQKYESIKPLDIQQQNEIEQEKPIDTYKEKMIEAASTLYISGTRRVNSNLTYELSRYDDPNQSVVMTDTDLAVMGFRLQKKTDCLLNATYAGTSLPIMCKLQF